MDETQTAPMIAGISKQIVTYCCPNVVEMFGGVQLILRHASILNRRNVPTVVCVRSNTRLSQWLETCEPKIVRCAPPDSVEVLPETDIEGLHRTALKVILVQSFGFLSSCPVNLQWRKCGVGAVIAVSRPLGAAVERRFGIAATVVYPSIDMTLFRAGAKEHSIAYMPRRNKIGIDEILTLAKSTFQGIAIDRMPPAEVASELSRASIFLAAGYSEGFGLPSLEAMASGCLVVGFAGGGGLDFMKDGFNCLMAEDGNNEESAEKLKLAIRLVSENKHHALVENAMRTASEYSPEREERDLVKFWTEFLAHKRTGSPTTGSPV